MTRPAKLADILLVEDNEDDVYLTRMAFEDSAFDSTIHVVNDGEKALDFLYRRGDYNNCPVPDLILLDLNLPKLNGIQILETLKSDETLSVIPVVMLTSSKAERDVLESYRHHASGYVSKPSEFSRLVDIVEAIRDFWFSSVILPRPSVSG
ncbi:response regulator [Maricaulis sp.]|jgi:two-component system response regulator|uniref:response regulator n=1 Tax=Maricaulis sp. TaxID=1486257 RepID=UPI001B177ABE|nr:response regulator [Maricaulis sp.]MBO6765422.1 response regulator [Maricaulis sp.]